MQYVKALPLIFKWFSNANQLLQFCEKQEDDPSTPRKAGKS